MEFEIIADSRPNSGRGAFHVNLDSGETMVRKSHVLEMVEAPVYARYRPNKFREILPVYGGIPEWVDELSYDVIKQHATVEATHRLGTNLPTAEVDSSKGNVTLFRDFGAAYGYTASEMLKAQQFGVPLDSARFSSVLKACDAKLEDLALNGDATLGIQGLAGISGVTTPSAETKTGGSITGWTKAAKLSEIVRDALTHYFSVINATKETSVPNMYAIPLAFYQLLSYSRREFADASAYPNDETGLQVVQRFLPGVSIVGWAKLTDTSYMFDRSDREVIECLIPKEPTALQQINMPFGDVKVPVKFRCGGVRSKFPTAIAKMTFTLS